MEEMASARLASPFHHLHRLYSSKPTNTSLPLHCLTFKTPFFLFLPYESFYKPTCQVLRRCLHQGGQAPVLPTGGQQQQQYASASTTRRGGEEARPSPSRGAVRGALLHRHLRVPILWVPHDEAVGDPSYPIQPGFQFEKLSNDWRCPTCMTAKSFFESKSVEIAGFAQNQQLGPGGNCITSGQKASLRDGGLLLGFLFFLSGYFLR